ncbi:TPA: DUF2591 domain-containing protein [Burkholderia vietnamiensis]|nr:DUF2591 domain-containing protein [Burkholderia vietnamiensis]
MNVSQLSGALLDYWVAKCEGAGATLGPRIVEFVDGVNRCRIGGAYERTYSPSTDWSIGGALIESHRIVLIPAVGDGGAWLAQTMSGNGNSQFGETALIAAMRSLVMAKFGAEISDEVPA